ncbi:unnamed protein product [Arabis nemorensis]|uniref:Uncharacterized protein n=1 Tax=Arabis nemorensis TaxID=586526 RepID=A0A565CCC2_9BRAS|nr:unnamed protein product [Arabis nemorensis]
MEGSSSKSHKRKNKDEQIKKNKKRNVINVNPEDNKIGEKISNGSNENCGRESFGVFEFPWMEESMISTSLDWSLPGSLFPLVDDGNQIFEDNSEVRWPVKRDCNDRLEFEAFECIWTFISD